MYVVHYEYETENDKIVFETYQVLFEGVLICECERKSDADDIARKLNSHDALIAALEDAKQCILYCLVDISGGDITIDKLESSAKEGSVIFKVNKALSLAKST